ncbi:MAG: hypothetical protein JWN68_2839 [Nocardioides sp.]|jgi:hypothetical protein|nr:hypothetical protein [Nocardioides sp.]
MHLGPRVSALLDGRLPPDEEERAWAHVHECHPCRDLVEREGWIKTRLAGLSFADRTDCGAPSRLKDSLLASCTLPAGQASLVPARFAASTSPRFRHRSLAAIGGGAAGAAVVGVLVLGAAGTPQLDRRAPSDLSRPTPSSNPALDDGPAEPPSRPVSRRLRNASDTPLTRIAAYMEMESQGPPVRMTP